MRLETLSDGELIQLYSQLLTTLKARGIIRSKNVIGDLAEYLTIEHYNATPGLPNLQAAAISAKNIDAISRDGERYSIKGTTGNGTGVFYGLPGPDSDAVPDRKFEYVIVVMFSDDYELLRINELTWDEFLKYKRWHSRMNAWNLSLTRDLLENTKTIYLADR